MKKLGTSIAALLAFTFAFANPPTTITRTLEWSEETAVTPFEEEDQVFISHFEGAKYDEAHPTLPYYIERIALSGNQQVKATLTNVIYEPFNRKTTLDNDVLASAIVPKVETEQERQSFFGKISFVPIRKIGENQFERLVSFTLRLSYTDRLSSVSLRGGNTYNSVLADGDVFKFAVNETGVHKLSYDFLKNEMGLPLDEIDPRTIKLYGNGGGIVPPRVGDERADDLVENAIVVNGESDGTFGAEDYILFYGEGANKWHFDTARQIFNYPPNFYDTKNYYFIKISAGNGLRVNDRASASGATYTSTEFNDFIRYEPETYNILHDWIQAQGSGQKFFGDYFKVKVEEDYSDEFAIENLVGSEPVYLQSSFAGRILLGSSGRFEITANGNTFQSSSFSTTGGGSVDNYASLKFIDEEFVPGTNALDISLKFAKGNDPSNEGWLDYIQVNFRRRLSMVGDQLIFRDVKTLDHTVSNFQLANAPSSLEIWDISNPLAPIRQATTASGNGMSFGVATEELREFIAFDLNNGLLSAEAISNEKILNQNIHSIDDVDYLIIYHKDFASEAERLAEHRRTFSGLNVATVDVEQVYNEFSSGRVDAGAIRDLNEMLLSRQPDKFRYCLLFGDGSFDSRDIYLLGGNYIPVYETDSSTNPISSYPTDDFFGLLSEGEGAAMNYGALDLGVGRLPVKNLEEAQAAVDKIIHYDVQPQNYRDWRNSVVFIGDDQDDNRHTGDADRIARSVEVKNSNLNLDKIYLDAYPNIATSGGERVPLVTEAINNNMFKGALAVVYLGHGGTKGWTQERVLKIEDVLSWNNLDKMPLIITATCSFSGFDNPAFTSAGELCFLNGKGGAIGLFTTVRPVFASSNAELTQDAVDTLFNKIGTEIPTLGDVLRLSKNKNGSPANSRKFLLLGDPAQKLALPNYNVVTTSLNDEPISNTATDTLRALQKVTIGGEIRDDFGNLLPDFNGIVYPSIFDKKVTYQTLAQGEDRDTFDFDLQKNIIFKGRASVTGGKFSFTFVVPKDIDYNFGECKISYYAADEARLEDAAGNYQEIVVGGTDPNALADDQGPRVEVFMNNEDFVFGGITSPDPLLLVKLEDDNGINVVGNAIGHDLAGVMDGNTQDYNYILNDFYEAALDDHTKGEVRFPLSDLPEGRHEMRVQAWDIANNPAEGYTEFVVVTSEEMALAHVLNYPNPFTSSTCFMFEHNKNGVEMDVQVQIYTISGRLIKTLNERIISTGSRLGSDNCIRWDGRDDYGDPLAKGVYLYKVKVQSPGIGEDTLEGESDFEKLVILK